MYKILIADDEEKIRLLIKKYGEYEGHIVHEAENGMQAVAMCRNGGYDVVIMDIMMPKLDGLSAMMRIREKKNIPIIVLSAKSEDSDKILGLSMGADDYITKPYNPMELTARVRSNLRRYLMLGSAGTVTVSDNILRNGGLSLDRSARQFYADGEPVKLTATEYKIAELLMENAGRVFSAEEIYSKVWNEASYSVENTVMVHIRHIREKIEIDPGNPRYLKVVWGIGYKIEKIPGG